MFNFTPAWKTAYPGAFAGFLVMHEVTNPASQPELARRKAMLESHLRERFASADRQALSVLPPLPAYQAYYKRFKKTYHVQAQWESIVFKGRAIPNVAALVEAMFMAEVKNLLLTAGHDLDSVRLPITLDVAAGTESYLLLRGQAQELKPGDMYMADQEGVISSILYGPDQRTQIGPETRHVLFAVYAPPGVGEEMVESHLGDIRDHVFVVSPGSRVALLQVFGAG